MSPTSYISGIASGIDTSSIIEQLLALQQRQVTLLTNQQAVRTTRLSAWTGLQTAIFGLKAASQALNNTEVWQGVSVSSGDTDVLTASGSAGAAPGSYSLTVSALARAHQMASQGYADPTAATGTGSLAITVGTTSYTVTIDSAHDTLEGLMEAINAASIGVTATVIDTGAGSTPYRLLLTSDETGTAKAITVETNLTGGAAPALSNTRGAAVTGVWSGSSSPTAGGTYTGVADETYTFTVAGDGTVGAGTLAITWSDGEGGSGSLDVGAGYTAGTALAVAEGVTVSLAAGDLVSADTFTVEVTSPTIQAPQDAAITLGSTSEGADPLVVTRGSNEIDDLLDGVTLNLKATSSGPVEVTVARDTTDAREKILAFVNSYNSILELAETQTQYDAESQIVGPLLGDGSLVALQGGLRSLVTGAVPELPAGWRTLAEIGITSAANGQLSIKYGTLDDALATNLAGVETLLGRVGTASDNDIRFLSSGDDTVASAGGYAVSISQAADRAHCQGGSLSTPTTVSPLTLNETNNQLVVTVDGVTSGTIALSTGSYTSGAALAEELETAINADTSLGAQEVAVSWVDDGGGAGHLEVLSLRYGSDSAIIWKDSAASALGTLGFVAGGSAYGRDVVGTIGGETATGHGRILKGDQGNAHTAGLSVEVMLTAEELLSQGASQGTVALTRGLADRVVEYADRLNDTTTGLVSHRQEAIQKQIDGLDAQIERVEARVAARRETLVRVFTQLETTLSQLQTEGSYLTNWLENLSSMRK